MGAGENTIPRWIEAQDGMVPLEVASLIDHRSALPVYHQVKQVLHQWITQGNFSPNQAIPPEQKLQEAFQVSRATVRQAIAELVSEGYLYRIQGKGTFVTRPKTQHQLRSVTSFTKEIQAQGMRPGSKNVLIAKVIPPKAVVDALEISPDEKVLKIERVRLINDEPCGLHTAYLPLRWGWDITRDELRRAESLYALLHQKYNVQLREAHQTLEATVAGKQEAEILGTSPGSPLLLVERTSYTLSGEAIEFVRMLYRGDRYRYHVHLTG